MTGLEIVRAPSKAMEGLRACMRLGRKTGIRFTVNSLNQQICPRYRYYGRRGIPRFCMYHLVYAGRGEEMRNLISLSKRKDELWIC